MVILKERLGQEQFFALVLFAASIFVGACTSMAVHILRLEHREGGRIIFDGEGFHLQRDE